jgi:transposase
MIRLTLNEEEQLMLTHTMKATADRRLRERCQAILMAARGRRHVQIAEDLGVNVRTIQRWLNAYQAHGLKGLPIRWAPGAPPRIPEPCMAAVLAWIKEGPARCGLDRANWTYNELAAHLYRTHGVAVSPSTMQRSCAMRGVRPYRPTYQYLKGDPTEQELARQDLAALKKSPGRHPRLAQSG